MITHNLNFNEAKNRLRPQFQLDPIHFPPLTRKVFKAAVISNQNATKPATVPLVSETPIIPEKTVESDNGAKIEKRKKKKKTKRQTKTKSSLIVTEEGVLDTSAISTINEVPEEEFTSAVESEIESEAVSKSSKRQKLAEKIQEKRDEEMMTSEDENEGFELNSTEILSLANGNSKKNDQSNQNDSTFLNIINNGN